MADYGDGFQNCLQRKAQIATQHQMRDLFALAFGAILENVEGQRCCFSDVFSCEVAATLCIKRCADILIGRLELPVDAEQGHQELRTAALEFENIDFVVADVAKQLVPDRPLAIESPAAQRLETDLPAVGDVFFSHHGVAHLFLLQDRCPMTTLFAVEAKFKRLMFRFVVLINQVTNVRNNVGHRNYGLAWLRRSISTSGSAGDAWKP